jgi:hypothetical protein
VIQEGAQELFIALEGASVGAGGCSDLVEAEERDVGQGVELEERPEVLDGVELGSVGGKVLGMKPWGRVEQGADLLGPVYVEAAPDHDQRSSQMAVQDAEELYRLGRPDVATGVETKEQLDAVAGWGDDQARHGRDLLVRTSSLEQYRRPAARRPTAAHERSHQEPAFVDEDEGGVEPAGFFLMRGHSCLTHA